MLGGLSAQLPAQSTETLPLTPCRIDAGSALPTAKANCATFEVAEDPANPNGRQISLRVAVVPALSVEPQPDPLVLFAGGPGQGAIESYLGLRGAFEQIRRKRAIVLVDQRGTGGSNRLGCDMPEWDEASFEFDLAVAVEATRTCLDALDGDPRFYTTSVAVDDLDQVRAALGYEQINLWGGSYGTRVALHYLREYPEHTRSVVIDGVIAADQVLGPTIALTSQESLDALFARCSEDSACAERFGDLAGKFAELQQRLKDEPRLLAIAHPRTGELTEQPLSFETLIGVVRMSSYSPLTRSLLPLMIDEAHADRYTMLAANVAMLNENFSDMLAMGMHNSVVCSEDAPLFDQALTDPSTLQETYIGNLQVDFLKASCDIWPRGLVDDNFHEPVQSDIPVLLLSGEYDPVTPPANAERAMQTLSNAKHIVAAKQGHIISKTGCVPELLGEFVEQPDPAAIDADCVKRLGAFPIFVAPTGPTP